MPAKEFAKSVACEFGKELRAARTERGLTQQTLAEQAGIDPVFVSFLENGHRQPSLAVVLALESVLNVAAGELVRRVTERLSAVTDAPQSSKRTSRMLGATAQRRIPQ
ncbi:helix-turn-helix transcriptional regulator [Rudaea sp.]|uniref:helix-turn-helix domain-containing protein n=1 Tax=Rudaea sp. TaxID=2136325 RepID=UPI00321F8D31